MTQTHHVTLADNGITKVSFGNDLPMAIIAGNCAIETREIALKTAETLKNICDGLGIGLVYKSSFDKANRTSANGKRGVGMEEGLKILQEIRQEIGVPVLTDLHESSQAAPVGEVVDILQIPAFLSRQTDLLVACAKTGKVVNIKKGQFMAPQDMHAAARKVADSGNDNIMLTERGTTFGYGNLVVDMRSFPIMAESGYPVIHDATHSVMMPSTHGDSSGGRREFVEPLARAAAAVGVAGFFIETHPDPAQAFSDKETQIPLEAMPALLANLQRIDAQTKEIAYCGITNAA